MKPHKFAFFKRTLPLQISPNLLVLPHQMALDILTVAQRGSCALIKTECCIYIPNYSKNVTEALKDLNKHITTIDALALDPFCSWLN